jgi:hypothetical protein
VNVAPLTSQEVSDVVALNSQEAIALAHALAGEKVSLDELSNALTKMLDNLMPYFGGNRRKARPRILNSLPKQPAYIRGVFAALLTLPSFDDLELLTVWEVWRDENPTGTEEEFGRWWAKAPLRESLKKDGSKIARLNSPRSAAKRLTRALDKQGGLE